MPRPARLARRVPCAARVTLTLALLTGLAVVGAGCGGSDRVADPGPPDPGITPANDTALHALQRFEACYEQEALDEYGLLFTADFRFAFSPDADPELVSQYGTSWRKADELAAAGHLFAGFTNTGGEFQPGARTIALQLNGALVIEDPNRPDSVRHYAFADVPAVTLAIELTTGEIFEVDAPHRLRLVRGDAAVLDAGQPADSTHWYIRRLEDLSVALPGARGDADPVLAIPLPARSATWGSIKATYR